MNHEQEQFFKEKYLNNFWLMKRYASTLLNEDQAEEVVQSTFYEAVEKIDVFFNHENADGWLRAILKNKIINYRRKNQSDLLHLVSIDSEVALQVTAAENMEDAIEQQESFESAKKTIEQTLSKEEQYILRRVIFENASHKEVASELGISVWSSQKRLERIRNKLSKSYPKYRD